MSVTATLVIRPYMATAALLIQVSMAPNSRIVALATSPRRSRSVTSAT